MLFEIYIWPISNWQVTYSKISYFCLVVSPFQEYVAWLQVSVYNLIRVDKVKSKQNLNYELLDFTLHYWKSFLIAYELLQVSFFAKFT